MLLDNLFGLVYNSVVIIVGKVTGKSVLFELLCEPVRLICAGSRYLARVRLAGMLYQTVRWFEKYNISF